MQGFMNFIVVQTLRNGNFCVRLIIRSSSHSIPAMGGRKERYHPVGEPCGEVVQIPPKVNNPVRMQPVSSDKAVIPIERKPKGR
jgi:hypothetical protein